MIIAFVLTVVFGTIYSSVQQSYRQNANDPQVQLAEDTVEALRGAPSLNDVISTDQAANVYAASANYRLSVTIPKVNITSSLAPFVVIYDGKHKVLATSASASAGAVSTLESLPSGVFSYATQHNEDQITWEPGNGARYAIVVKPYSGANTGAGFVLAGRSLREVEVREQQLTWIVVSGWFIALGGSLVLSLLLRKFAHGD